MDQFQEILNKIAELQASGEARSAEVAVLKQELARLQARGGRPDPGAGESASVGHAVVESPQFKRMVESGAKNCDQIEVDASLFRAAMHGSSRAAALSSSNVGSLVDNPLLPMISPVAQRMPKLKALMRTSPVSTETVRYTKESGFYDLYTELALAAASGQAVLKVKYAGGFVAGATVKIASGVTEEAKIVSSVDFDASEITLTTNLSGSHAQGVQVTSAEFAYTEETDLAPRAKWDTEEVSEPVKNLSIGLVSSAQVLEDAPRLAALINERLPAAMARAEESQILNGDGSSKQLSGILNDADLQSIVWSAQASGTTKIDMIRLAAHLAVQAHYMPTTVALNPQEARDIDLVKDDEGRYILMGGPQSDGAPRLWRLNVVESLAIAAGTALVGSFSEGLTLYERSGVSIRIFEQHADFAERGMIYVQASMREALCVERGESFVKIDFDSAP